MSNIIEINGLRKKYFNDKQEILAIDDISFNVKEGEFLVIVGPSGCGKSTLLNIIGDIDNRNAGNIKLYNDVKVGYMLQTDCLFSWLTILDNALLGLKINNLLTEENINYVKELLNTYGLAEFMNSYPSSLSGGMKQRVALIRTLALKPDILLLDEPFSALDYQTRLMVADDVYKIIKKERKTVIMITHDVGEACSIADRVIILTDRPAKVKKEILINMENKGSPVNNRKCKEFSDYYEMIWKEIDKHE